MGEQRELRCRGGMDEVRSKSCRKRKVCETRSEERKKNKRQTWKQAKKIYQLKNQHQSVTIYKFFLKQVV